MISFECVSGAVKIIETVAVETFKTPLAACEPVVEIPPALQHP
jgi:hypothetical protein